MKKILIIFITIIAVNTYIFAQSLTIYEKQQKSSIPIINYCEFFDGTVIQSCAYDSAHHWIIDSTQLSNIWQIGMSHKVLLNSSWTQPNVIITDTINPYPPNNLSSFYFKVYKPDWAIANNLCWSYMNIVFFHKFDMDSLHAGGFIDISYDGGQTWRNVVFDTNADPITPYSASIYHATDTLLNGIPAFTGKSNGWTSGGMEWVWDNEHAFDFDSCIIRFNFISDSTVSNREGWLIDNLYFYSKDACFVSIQEITNSDKVNIFPNPVSNESKIEFENLKCNNYNIKIFNNLGNLIVSSVTTENYFSLRNIKLNKGIYFYKLFDKKAIYSGKFIKE